MSYLNASRLMGRDWDDETDAAIRALDSADTAETALDGLVSMLDARANAAKPGPLWDEGERNRRAAVKALALSYELRDQLAVLVKRMCLESGLDGAELYVKQAEK